MQKWYSELQGMSVGDKYLTTNETEITFFFRLFNLLSMQKGKPMSLTIDDGFSNTLLWKKRRQFLSFK